VPPTPLPHRKSPSDETINRGPVCEHLAHTLKPVPLFGREGRCVPVGTGDKIDKTAYTRGVDVKKST